MRHEIDLAPAFVRRFAEHEEMRAAVVGNELRRADLGEIVVAGVWDLDRRMQRADRGGHLVDAIRLSRGGRSRAMRKANSASATRMWLAPKGSAAPLENAFSAAAFRQAVHRH